MDMAELLAFLFFVQNGFFALIGIIALYRYLWSKIAQSDSGRNMPEPMRRDAGEPRELELETELRSLREMADMLALEQQRMQKEAALIDKVRKGDRGA